MIDARAVSRRSVLGLLGLTACVNQSGVPYEMRRWNREFPAYRVIGNIFYVGTTEIAQFVIETSAGLVLLDTGFEASVPRLREHIEGLGLRFGDIKLILTSHAHIDHVQAHALVRQQTGARVAASAADAAYIESGGRGEPVFDGVYSWPPCPVDRRIGDGESVKLGDVELVAHLTPGHTPGATTWTMQVEHAGRRWDTVFFPSANLNRGVKLIGNARYPHIVEDFKRSFAVWKSLPCQVFLADHGDFYDMRSKYARLSDSPQNPFIDPEGYRRFIADAEDKFRERLASEQG